MAETKEPAPGKRRYLACYDYGMGGIWLLMDARSKDEIEERYPELEVCETRPRWMSGAEEREYRATCLAHDMCWDVDARPSGWLKTLVDGREERDAGPESMVVGLIFLLLGRAIPIALLAGAVWLVYWLLS